MSGQEKTPFERGYEAWVHWWIVLEDIPSARYCPAKSLPADSEARAGIIAGWKAARKEWEGKK